MNGVVAEMKSGAADECSGKWFDEEGNLLFVAFANRIPSRLEGKLPLDCTLSRTNFFLRRFSERFGSS